MFEEEGSISVVDGDASFFVWKVKGAYLLPVVSF